MVSGIRGARRARLSIGSHLGRRQAAERSGAAGGVAVTRAAWRLEPVQGIVLARCTPLLDLPGIAHAFSTRPRPGSSAFDLGPAGPPDERIDGRRARSSPRPGSRDAGRPFSDKRTAIGWFAPPSGSTGLRRRGAVDPRRSAGRRSPPCGSRTAFRSCSSTGAAEGRPRCMQGGGGRRPEWPPGWSRSSSVVGSVRSDSWRPWAPRSSRAATRWGPRSPRRWGDPSRVGRVSGRAESPGSRSICTTRTGGSSSGRGSRTRRSTGLPGARSARRPLFLPSPGGGAGRTD